MRGSSESGYPASPTDFLTFCVIVVVVFCQCSARKSWSYLDCKAKHSLNSIWFPQMIGDALSNSRLSKEHVIRVYHVQNEPSCRVKCFLEPDCVAYNYGKNNEGNLQCQLCNKSHLQVPSNDVMLTPGFIFRSVAKVLCMFLFPQYLLTIS